MPQEMIQGGTQGRQGARSQCAALAAGTRRRGDRITGLHVLVGSKCEELRASITSPLPPQLPTFERHRFSTAAVSPHRPIGW